MRPQLSQDPTSDSFAHQVLCPNCSTSVPYARFCSNCGFTLPPMYATIPESTQPPCVRRHSRMFILGIILVILLGSSIAGVAGYMWYSNNQTNILKAAQNSELTQVNQAVSQLQITCFSNHTDTSHFYRGPPPSGFFVLVETFGVYNPSKFPIDATWTLQYSYPVISTTLSANQITFHVGAQSTAYPEFPFIINISDAQAFATIPAGTMPQYTVTLDGTYNVYGTYSTYNISQHQSFDSSTNMNGTSSNTGGGQFGSGTGGGSSTMPRCP